MACNTLFINKKYVGQNTKDVWVYKAKDVNALLCPNHVGELKMLVKYLGNILRILPFYLFIEEEVHPLVGKFLW